VRIGEINLITQNGLVSFGFVLSAIPFFIYKIQQFFSAPQIHSALHARRRRFLPFSPHPMDIEERAHERRKRLQLASIE
jgi:hypothetical protein